MDGLDKGPSVENWSDKTTDGYALHEKAVPSGPYYSSIVNELKRRKSKLVMELQLVESALTNMTPEVEQALQVARTLDQLGMRTRL